jgi:hypothetical protein
VLGEGRGAASHDALGRVANSSAKRRGKTARKKAAKKAARTRARTH